MGQKERWGRTLPGNPWLKYTRTHTHTQSMMTRERRESKEGRGQRWRIAEKKMQWIERGDDRTWGEIEIWVEKKMKEIKSDKWRYWGRKMTGSGEGRRETRTQEERRKQKFRWNTKRESESQRWKTPLEKLCIHHHAGMHTTVCMYCI